MLELIQRYYDTERHAAMVSVAMGVALLVLAAGLCRTSTSPSLARGMAGVFLAAGLLQASAGSAYAVVASQRAQAAATLHAGAGERQIARQERDRMARVLGSGFTGGVATYTTLLLAGLALVLSFAALPTRKGLGLALMVVGSLGHCLEAFSMQANRRHLDHVVSWLASHDDATAERRPSP